jgi:D-alanine-D-alanine ligase
MDSGRLKVVVTFNDDLHLKPHLNRVEQIGEAEVLDTAREVAEVTDGILLPVRDSVLEAFDALRQLKPDVVFNLCEGVLGNPRWEMNFALGLEMLAIPFTGCDPIATAICGDKWLVKQLLRAAGLPTPDAYVVTDFNGALAGLKPGATYIVKPSREDAGIGIDATAVCENEQQVARRVAHVLDTYHQPALVEEFVDGAEYNQALYVAGDGIHVLPPGEIVFDQSLTPAERVVGWKAKWDSGSPEDRATRNRTPGVMSDTMRRDLSALCESAASLLSLGGYCRFDLRQSRTGQVWIVDINPNPDIGRGSGLRLALQAAGVTFSEFVNSLIMAALNQFIPKAT